MLKQTLTLTTTKLSEMAMSTVQTIEKTENQELSTLPVRTVAKRLTPHKNVILEPMQQTDGLLGIENQWNRVKINKINRSKQLEVSRLWPKP